MLQIAENTAMRKTVVKKPKKLAIKSAVQPAQSKPRKTGLSKSDPDYYSKIGQISAKRRKLPSSFFSDMARKSHKNRTEYHGGRKKKDLAAELKAATE